MFKNGDARWWRAEWQNEEAPGWCILYQAEARQSTESHFSTTTPTTAKEWQVADDFCVRGRKALLETCWSVIFRALALCITKSWIYCSCRSFLISCRTCLMRKLTSPVTFPLGRTENLARIGSPGEGAHPAVVVKPRGLGYVNWHVFFWFVGRNFSAPSHRHYSGRISFFVVYLFIVTKR